MPPRNRSGILRNLSKNRGSGFCAFSGGFPGLRGLGSNLLSWSNLLGRGFHGSSRLGSSFFRLSHLSCSQSRGTLFVYLGFRFQFLPAFLIGIL